MLYLTVRRWFGPIAGLIAGTTFVLLLVSAAYTVTRALDAASTRWLVFAGALVGFGFLTKMLQALLVVPMTLTVAYLDGNDHTFSV